MIVAFIITRISEYRLLGPVIDRALQVGWRVECWHNYGRPREGAKGYLFPDTDSVPRFQHGQPVVRTYGGPVELAAWLEGPDIDVVVSTGTVQFDTAGALPQKWPRWICLQAMLDTFLNHPLEALESCDLVALQSAWWAEWAISHYAAAGSGDIAALRGRLARLVVCPGLPELDALRLVDRDEVRRRWGIPAGQPVVVLLPFPQGIGKTSFWPKKIFGEPSRARRLLNVARHGQFNYWRRAWTETSERHVVRAARAFCDRNGAFLLVKSRVKTPIPAYTQAIADKCVYDESYYPPTIIEALSIANLCISHYSASVLEAAALGVPNLCVAFTAEDYLGSDAEAYRSFDAFFTRDRGGVFEFEGVSRTMAACEAVAEIGSRSLSDFHVDPAARRAYVEKFIGQVDGEAAARLIEMVAANALATSELRHARV